ARVVRYGRRGRWTVAGAGNGSSCGGSTGVAPGVVTGPVSAAGAGSTENNTPLTSPIRGNPAPISAGATGGFGGVRRRNVSISGFDSSPGSPDDVEEVDAHEERRKQPV